MSIYEASLKTTDQRTGAIRYRRLLTMPARNTRQVEAHVVALGLTKGAHGDLVVYRF